MAAESSNDLLGNSAASMLRAVRNREISPVELVDGVIELIEQRNPSITGMVVFGFDEARERAKAAEASIMRGDDLGPLHGLPVAMKDCFDFKSGWVTTFGGVRTMKNYVAKTNCTFVERMEVAGAIIVGKTNAPSLGFRGTTDNFLFGPSRNPFDRSKNAGGSSGGSGALVADGLLPIAEGTDGGGSIRIPAAWCGVYGYKASFGRIPNIGRPNMLATATPFVAEGPITRTVEDAALALLALSGYHPRDPLSIQSPFDPLAALKQSIKGWKIGYTRDYGIFPVDPEVARVTEEALSAFTDAGAHVEEIKLNIRRSQQELSDVWCRYAIQGDLSALAEFKKEGVDLLADHADDLPPEVIQWCDVGRRMSAQDYLSDFAARTEIYDEITDALARYRILVSPTLACLPVDNATNGNTVGPREINGEQIDPLIGWCMTYLINFTGHPAATVPAGLSKEGLPVGLQIVGSRYADEDVLAASAVFEQRRPWINTYEICANRPLNDR